MAKGYARAVRPLSCRGLEQRYRALRYSHPARRPGAARPRTGCSDVPRLRQNSSPSRVKVPEEAVRAAPADRRAVV